MASSARPGLAGLPDIDWERLSDLWPNSARSRRFAEQLSIDARYEGYLARQRQDIAAYRRDEALALPADLNYGAVGSLSNEIRQKLQNHRPATLGQAARISGVTPAALVALLRFVRRQAA
jgi:tRNA uridine 5-carboxymethylaminomethyl modification enzyme